MNSIRQTQALNKRELEAAVPPSASWHADYRDTAYIYIGGFPFDLSEGDLLTIFSQYGNPTHLNLVRDRESGKSKGFAFLKYEDQRSCDLAVDNLGGAQVLGRLLRVDHTRYKKKEGEDEETWRVERWEGEGDGNGDVVNGNGKRSSSGEEMEDDDGEKKKKRRKRGMIKEERELEELLRIKEGEEEDPMRQYLIEEKKQEIEKALARIEKKERRHHTEMIWTRDGPIGTAIVRIKTGITEAEERIPMRKIDTPAINSGDMFPMVNPRRREVQARDADLETGRIRGREKAGQQRGTAPGAVEGTPSMIHPHARAHVHVHVHVHNPFRKSEGEIAGETKGMKKRLFQN
ncbi:hypothetical protein EPUS_04177 [Endocarpon pusillum Z07020]|uniref:RRM domain-containing protein n=1 Tax=Endocarpon pusillum (strain Z07020 / HMAS-L-300199) TaxID=1263415 RepID=U1I2V3_ENDPU|nr:uncharacterized protein EPUS_04177 [Endocarpon pusillum Z07020]ERF76319.1 hypothetical protein EPUS_04177 [Endocarpon pusillum Z07020]